MLQFLLPSKGRPPSLPPLPRSSGRQHPLLLWFDLLDGQNGPLFFRYWLSLGAYYLLLFACAWFVLQWFRRGRPWARTRSLLAGKSRVREDEHQHQHQQKRENQKKKHAVPPRLLYMESARNRRLLAKTTVLRQPYVPSPWLGHRLGGHMQSFMFATWCPPGDRGAVGRLVSRQDRVFSSFDGGVFRMDWFGLSGKCLAADAPVVIVFPGIVGQGTNVYVRHLAAHLSTKYGWRVVAKSWRGIGSRLTTRRPETWDDAAVSDARDAIRHVRDKVGRGVPVMGVGFSFGGCLMTAIAGSVPQEEHGLCGMVSISGLFDMSAMMKHIAEQYPYPYGFANTKMTVRNYRKFKVSETLSAGASTAAATPGAAGGTSSGIDRKSGGSLASGSGGGSSSGGSGGDSSGGGSNGGGSSSSSGGSRGGDLVGSSCREGDGEGGDGGGGGGGCGDGGGSGDGGGGYGGDGSGNGGRKNSGEDSAGASEGDGELAMMKMAARVGEEEEQEQEKERRGVSHETPTGRCSGGGRDSVGGGGGGGGGRDVGGGVGLRKRKASRPESLSPPSPTASVRPSVDEDDGNSDGDGDDGSTRRTSQASGGSGWGSRCWLQAGLGSGLGSELGSRLGLASGWAGPKMEEGDGAGSAGKRGFKQASPAFVTAGEMSKMKDASAFHEAFTLPFTGDATVEAFFERIERIMGSGVSSVKVPALCLLAKDDPLCPPLAWVGALERAAKSDGIVVAMTDQGGHCGWFDGLGADSWLDRATGDFLASALELSKETAGGSSIDDANHDVRAGGSAADAAAAVTVAAAGGAAAAPATTAAAAIVSATGVPFTSATVSVTDTGVAFTSSDTAVTATAGNVTGTFDAVTSPADAVTAPVDAVSDAAAAVSDAADAVSASADTVTVTADTVTGTADTVTGTADTVTGTADAVSSTVDKAEW